jgi:hypothetical protein
MPEPEVDHLNLLAHCECCEEPIPEGQEYVHPEEGDSYCRRCVIDLLGAERDALTRQLAGAVARAERLEAALRQIAANRPLDLTAQEIAERALDGGQ